MNPSTTEPEPENIPAADILDQMERVLVSRHFRQTRTLDKFLRHAITKTLEGLEGELKESLIGREVFHRGEDFNPALDAVVRVQAGMLRKKLASYYAEEGLADQLVIELPKGCYVPVFHLREPMPQTEDPTPAQTLLPASETSFAKTAPPVWQDSVPSPRWRVPPLWQIAVAFLLGMTLMFGMIRGRYQPLTTGPTNTASVLEQPLAPLWEKFFEPDSNTVLAYGTPQFFQFKGLYLRDVVVNTPQEIEAGMGERLALVRKAFKTPLEPVEIYTGVGEAHGINTLSRYFWQNNRELKIARSRLVGWQEVKNSNLIFLSSMRFHTLADQLNYPNDFVINAGAISGTITNRQPAAGEQAQYAIQGGEHYAVVTLWPGKADNRRILQLSGNTTWGTLAAAEYVTDKDAQQKLREHLEQCRRQKGASQHAPYFQVLVKAEVQDNQTISLAYVTHHDLELNGVATETVRAALK